MSGDPWLWRATVDDMLTVCHAVASDDPRESINRLIDWHVLVALDPSVSSEAAALVAAWSADAERYRWLRSNPQWLGWEHDFQPSEVDRAVDAARVEAPI